MFHEFPSHEVSKLVLGYLIDAKCIQTASTFVEECTHFQSNKSDIHAYMNMNADASSFDFSVFGETLESVIKGYSEIKSVMSKQYMSSNQTSTSFNHWLNSNNSANSVGNSSFSRLTLTQQQNKEQSSGRIRSRKLKIPKKVVGNEQTSPVNLHKESTLDRIIDTSDYDIMDPPNNSRFSNSTLTADSGGNTTHPQLDVSSSNSTNLQTSFENTNQQIVNNFAITANSTAETIQSQTSSGMSKEVNANGKKGRFPGVLIASATIKSPSNNMPNKDRQTHPNVRRWENSNSSTPYRKTPAIEDSSDAAVLNKNLPRREEQETLKRNNKDRETEQGTMNKNNGRKLNVVSSTNTNGLENQEDVVVIDQSKIVTIKEEKEDSPVVEILSDISPSVELKRSKRKRSAPKPFDASSPSPKKKTNTPKVTNYDRTSSSGSSKTSSPNQLFSTSLPFSPGLPSTSHFTPIRLPKLPPKKPLRQFSKIPNGGPIMINIGSAKKLQNVDNITVEVESGTSDTEAVARLLSKITSQQNF